MTAIPSRLAAGRLHYAWVIAAVTFAVVLVTAGVRAAPGVLIVPLEEEFHWSRATISFAKRTFISRGFAPFSTSRFHWAIVAGVSKDRRSM